MKQLPRCAKRPACTSSQHGGGFACVQLCSTVFQLRQARNIRDQMKAHLEPTGERVLEEHYKKSLGAYTIYAMNSASYGVVMPLCSVIGLAAVRERVVQYVYISVATVS